MQYVPQTVPEMLLVGITARTNNRQELDVDSGKIGPTVNRYYSQQLAEQIQHRTNPGVTIAAYCDYQSDEDGDYTYFIGEQVSQLSELPEGFSSRIIPAMTYRKFTAGPGKMPEIVIKAWLAIWKMSEEALGGPRSYNIDFEVYDERSADANNAEVDIFIG